MKQKTFNYLKLRHFLYLLLCVVSLSCSKSKDVVLEHWCNGKKDVKWMKLIYTNDKVHQFYRCEMCNTVIEVDGGIIIKEHTEHKHKPVNRWIQ